MPVKHTPTQEVHEGTKGGITACGFNTNTNPNHWVNTSEKVTCPSDAHAH